jgi:hypothetical protein
MVGTVKQGNLDINNRESGKNTGRYRFAQTLFNCRNELTRNSTTLDLINEFKALARFVRLHGDPDVAVLTFTTGLLDELAFDFNLLLDRFTVGNLRRTNVGFHIEFALHAIHQNFQVQFTHTGNNGLAGLFIGTDTE